MKSIMKERKLIVNVIKTFPWEEHTKAEDAIIKALIEDRDIEIKYLYCNGGLSSFECEHIYMVYGHKEAKQPNKMICKQCKSAHSKLYSYSNDINKEIKVGTYKMGNTSEFQARLNQTNLSQYYKRIRSTNRESMRDYFIKNKLFVKDLRELYANAIMNVNILAKKDILSIALVFNGRFVLPNAYLNAFMNNDIPVILHERGGIMNSTALTLNCSFGDSYTMYSSLTDAGTFDLNKLRMIYDYQQKRVLEGEQNNSSCVVREGDVVQNKKSDSNYILYLTSSSEEYYADDLYCSYEEQIKSLKLLVKIAAERRVNLIIRVHPNARAKLLHPIGAEKFLKEIAKFRNMKNVRIINPEEMISTYRLLSNSIMNFVDTSHILVECMMARIPCIVLSKSRIYKKYFPNWHITERSKIKSCLYIKNIVTAEEQLMAARLYYHIRIGSSYELNTYGEDCMGERLLIPKIFRYIAEKKYTKKGLIDRSIFPFDLGNLSPKMNNSTIINDRLEGVDDEEMLLSILGARLAEGYNN